MGKVALETYVTWSNARGVDSINPEPRGVRISGRRPVVKLGDIALPAGLPHPNRGITMLYGFRDSLEVLHARRSEAAENGLNMRTITVEVDVGEIIQGMINEENIGKTSFVSLKRMNTDLQDVLLDRVNKLARKERPKHVDYTTVLEAGARPDLICDAMKTAPFSHIEVVAYRVPVVGSRKGRQVATLLKTKNVVQVDVRGDETPFDVELPN